MPTETVYGLAADATSDRAVAAIYAAKERPALQPAHRPCSRPQGGARACRLRRRGRDARPRFWPGPLTLVLPAAPSCRVSLLARAGLDTVALRSPAHERSRALIEAAGVPLAAPSANRSGRVSPTTAAHVLADLDGRVDWILDGGPCRYGVESTIVACRRRPDALLRPGAIARETLEFGARIADRVVRRRRRRRPTAPGQLASHYAPSAKLRLDAAEARADEAVLDFGRLAGGKRGRRAARSLAGRATSSRRRRICSRYLRALDAAGRGADRGRADSRPWARGGDQRPAPAGGRAAQQDDGRAAERMRIVLLRCGVLANTRRRLQTCGLVGGICAAGMNPDLSWDEFRLVKAIADARSLVGAAERLGLNHSTVFRRLARSRRRSARACSSGPGPDTSRPPPAKR